MIWKTGLSYAYAPGFNTNMIWLRPFNLDSMIFEIIPLLYSYLLTVISFYLPLLWNVAFPLLLMIFLALLYLWKSLQVNGIVCPVLHHCWLYNVINSEQTHPPVISCFFHLAVLCVIHGMCDAIFICLNLHVSWFCSYFSGHNTN